MKLKKMIASATCSALLLTSVSSFAQMPQEKLTVLNTEFSALHEVHSKSAFTFDHSSTGVRKLAESILENNISEAELLEYVKMDMDPEEQIAFDLKIWEMKSKIDQSTDLSELQNIIALAVKDMKTGSNFLPLSHACDNGTLSIVIFIASAIAGIYYLNQVGEKADLEGNRDSLNVEIQEIEGTIATLKADGLSEDSFFVASLRADQSVLRELVSQTTRDIEDVDQLKKVSGIVTLSTAGVGGLYALYAKDCW